MVAASVRGQRFFNGFNSFSNANTGFNNRFTQFGQQQPQRNTGTQNFNFLPGPVGPSFSGQNQQDFSQGLGQIPSIVSPSNVVFNQAPGTNGQSVFTLQMVFNLDANFQNNVRNLARTISQRLQDQDQFFLDIGEYCLLRRLTVDSKLCVLQWIPSNL